MARNPKWRIRTNPRGRAWRKTSTIQGTIHQLSASGPLKTKEYAHDRPLGPKTVRHMGTLLHTMLGDAVRLALAETRGAGYGQARWRRPRDASAVNCWCSSGPISTSRRARWTSTNRSSRPREAYESRSPRVRSRACSESIGIRSISCAHRLEQEGDKAAFGAGYEDNNLVFCKPSGQYYSPDPV